MEFGSTSQGAPAEARPREILRQFFGHAQFRGPQERIIQRVVQGGHCLVIMPTGMGKSLCYQVPALMQSARVRGGSPQAKQPLAIVLSPLIALMKDQVDSLRERGIDAALVNSALTRDERTRRYDKVAAGAYSLLYVTPERFRKSKFLEVLERRRVTLLAVDEAHCISQWGHDFRPDYSRVAEIRQQLGFPTTIALTATATPRVQEDIVQQLGLRRDEVELFHEGIDRPNLVLDVAEVWGDDEKLDYLQAVRSRHPGSGIVYFTLINTLLRFSDCLRERSMPHLVYHGDLERNRRRRIQDQFMREPDHLVLATNAFGMGIDKEDIRFVIHADVPGSLESYYQEIGRAGRDGQRSECLLLYDQRDLTTQMEFLRWSNPDAEFYERVYDFLKHESEAIRAFGLEWLRERLHHKDTHDHRLETALAILERFGVISGSLEPLAVEVIAALPDSLRDPAARQAKLQQDLEKLYALVQYVQTNDDRKAFLHEYFGIPWER